MELTDDQRNILNLKKGLHLVLAPPGSGKTKLIAERVAEAKDDEYEDGDIICLTFTNRAAKEMKDRVIGQYDNNQILIGNFHKYAINFLKENRFISLNSCILDEEEQSQIIDEITKDLKYGYDENGQKIKNYIYNPELIKLATYLKQKEMGFPSELFLKPKASDIPNPFKAKEVCEKYINEKQSNGYIDFDDLLTLTYYHLTHSDKAKLKLGQFKWIQIDEVQDLNPLQWAILHEITAPQSHVVYFGDYEQAIFSFMGAKLESLHNIEQLIKKNPTKNSILNLCENFRSPSYLLDIYVKYAETHWRPSWKQTPFSRKQQNASKDALKIFKINGTEIKEARYIAQNIIPQMLVNNEKTAIIVKENIPADIISAELKQNNISHFKISGFDLFRRKYIKGLMAFFSILCNEYDRLSWARIFNEFNIISTLRDSRKFINELFTKGLTPIDILGEQDTNSLTLNQFSSRTNKFFETYSDYEMIIFDTETTGLNTEEDDIIQIAAIKIANGIIQDTFEVYLKTLKDITDSEKVHNITNDFLDKNGVESKVGLSKFVDFCGKNPILVAHNIKFDYNILKNNLLLYCNEELSNYCNKYYDTLEISKLLYPNLTSYKLKDLLEFLKIEGVNSHNAMDDAKATVSLIKKLNSDYNKLEQNEYLSNLVNIKIFKKLVQNFGPIYSIICKRINEFGLLRNVADDYFTFINISDEEKKEVKKLTDHFNNYTDSDDPPLTLKQKIHEYIPEYLLYKESDLYLGNEQIVISTVYKAKGLEFDNVIIVGATNDMYPRLWMLEKDLRNASTQEQQYRLKEQITKKTLEDARALYVAMTRAKNKIYITYYTEKWNQYGRMFPQQKSRFITCIENKFITQEVN